MADVKSNYPPQVNRSTPRDPYDRHREELDSPASSAFPITPSQSDLPVTIRGLYVGGVRWHMEIQLIDMQMYFSIML